MDLQRHFATFAKELVGLSMWLVLLLIVFVPLERIFGNHSQKVFRTSFGADLFYYFLNGILPKLLLTTSLTLLATLLHRLVRLAFYSSVAAMPLWLRLSAALVVNEIGGYWRHRWSHQIPFLRRFHGIHPSAEEIDWLVTSHNLLGLFHSRKCQEALRLAGVAGLHPAFHHRHHTNDGPEFIDKNFAATFPWVDKCFGTLYLPPAWPAKYGSDTSIASDLTGQLLDPLK